MISLYVVPSGSQAGVVGHTWGPSPSTPPARGGFSAAGRSAHR